MTVLGLSSESWQVLANIATIAGVIAIIVTLVAAKKQLVEMSRVRSLTAFLEVHKLLELLEEGSGLREFIYQLEGEPGKLAVSDQKKVEQMIRHIDTIAYLVKKKYIDSKDFIGLYFTIVERLWNKLKPFVYSERTKRGNPVWASHFEWLGKEAEKFRLRYHPEVNVGILTQKNVGDKMNTAKKK